MKPNQSILIIGVLFLMNLFMVGCGNKSSSNTVAAPAAVNYMANGRCYSSVNGQEVPVNQCPNTGYYKSNNLCFSSATNQVVDISLCNNLNVAGNGSVYRANGRCYVTGTNQEVAMTVCDQQLGIGTGLGTLPINNTAILPQGCYGPFYYVNTYGVRVGGYCTGFNCRGFTLFRYETNQAVTCL